MLATTASLCGYANPTASVRGFRLQLQSHSTQGFPLKVRASQQGYPLASKILVRNIPYSTCEISLQKGFSSFGEIAQIKVVQDAVTKRSKGYAFIQYTCQDDAMLALETMDQKVFDGRKIYVELAKPGKDDFGGRLKSSGPPKKWNLPEHVEEVDCWY